MDPIIKDQFYYKHLEQDLLLLIPKIHKKVNHCYINFMQQQHIDIVNNRDLAHSLSIFFDGLPSISHRDGSATIQFPQHLHLSNVTKCIFRGGNGKDQEELLNNPEEKVEEDQFKEILLLRDLPFDLEKRVQKIVFELKTQNEREALFEMKKISDNALFRDLINGKLDLMWLNENLDKLEFLRLPYDLKEIRSIRIPDIKNQLMAIAYEQTIIAYMDNHSLEDGSFQGGPGYQDLMFVIDRMNNNEFSAMVPFLNHNRIKQYLLRLEKTYRGRAYPLDELNDIRKILPLELRYEIMALAVLEEWLSGCEESRVGENVKFSKQEIIEMYPHLKTNDVLLFVPYFSREDECHVQRVCPGLILRRN